MIRMFSRNDREMLTKGFSDDVKSCIDRRMTTCHFCAHKNKKTNANSTTFTKISTTMLKMGRQQFRGTISLLLIAASVSSAEARIGTFRSEGSNKLFQANPEILRERLDIVDPYGQTVTSNSFYTYRSGYEIESSTTTTTANTRIPTSPRVQDFKTDVAVLADCFDHALVAANQNEEDIHVAHLLAASERLEGAMRRIGFSQSANDIAGNINKIRNVYNRAPQNRRDSMPALLQYEKDSGVLDGKKLPEKSAAMGFLWLGRSLNYQFDMFSHMLEHDTEPYEAASIAYERDLKPHLSWPLQKLGKAAMTTLKPRRRKEMFAQIGGFSEENYGAREEQATRRDLRHMMDNLKPMLSRWKQVFSELELEAI